MKKRVVVGVAAITAVVAFRCLPRAVRDRAKSTVKNRISGRLDRMFANLPETFPPKLMMSVLPKLQSQNEQIINLLQSQNELLREHQHAHEVATVA